MKKLFSLEFEGMLFVEEENSVYLAFGRGTKFFYDANGKILSDYKRPCIKSESSNYNYDFEPMDEDELIFNKYGVACADDCLVDKDGNVIPDTKLDYEVDCGEDDRYFTFALLTKEQCDSIDSHGVIEGLTLDVYDTKTRKYVLKGIPESKMKLSFFDGEPEVVLAAADLIDDFDTVRVCEKGTIIGVNGNCKTVFNYYG